MINTLDYFLPSDLNRALISADGGRLNYVAKTIRGQLHLTSVLSNKAWATTSMWTQFQIRRKFICLNCDTGNSQTGGNVYYYLLDPGFWMPLECEVGWMKYFVANEVEWHGSNMMTMPAQKEQVAAGVETMFARFYSEEWLIFEPKAPISDCNSVDRHWGPYRNTLLDHSEIDFGGDIGLCDSITLEYHTGDERHTYAKHPTLGALGLVRWSKPGFPEGTFNIISDKLCTPLPVCGRTPLP